MSIVMSAAVTTELRDLNLRLIIIYQVIQQFMHTWFSSSQISRPGQLKIFPFLSCIFLLD